MLNEAINIGEGVGRELETNPDIVHLRLEIADWYLMQGQREKAISVYEKLADTQDEKRMEIQSLSRKIAAAERSGSVVGPIRGQTPPQRVEEMTVDNLLEEVEKLLEENRFSEAKALLTMKEQKVHSTEAETINQAYRKLELAEENYLEKKISMISMNRDMEQARRLLEEERYEEVISRLEALEPEEDSREIKELKQFAIEKLINRERNRAAKIFLIAKETQDPARKKEYFLQCLAILKALVDEYPLSHLNQKLISHIKIVEEELGKLEMNTGAGEIRNQ
jgi:outer membrane protein assembly factor BamD (BamD/ComL family)